MRPLYLSAIPVGASLLFLTVPAFIALAIASLISKVAERKFKEMMGGVECEQ